MRTRYEDTISAGACDIPTPDELDAMTAMANEAVILAVTARIVQRMRNGHTTCGLSSDEYRLGAELKRRFGGRGWVLEVCDDQRDGAWASWRRAAA